jgi:hypothetical protein
VKSIRPCADGAHVRIAVRMRLRSCCRGSAGPLHILPLLGDAADAERARHTVRARFCSTMRSVCAERVEMHAALDMAGFPMFSERLLNQLVRSHLAGDEVELVLLVYASLLGTHHGTNVCIAPLGAPCGTLCMNGVAGCPMGILCLGSHGVLQHSALRRRFVCSADGTRSTARVTLGAAGLHDLAKISELRASLGESALELLRRERAATMQTGEVGP